MTERERLIELIRNAPKTDTVYGDIRLKDPVPTLQTIADHLLSNGVIVPPCKVGDTVYCIRYDKARNPFVKALEVRTITTFGINKFLVFTTKDDTWGTMAFATEEEAEKALKEKQG